ncbi:hypothetical protein A3Q56_07988, partial [Intoshia linei]
MSSETKINESNSTEKTHCKHCEKTLMGHRYVMKNEFPYHIKCFEQLFSDCCHLCKTTILVDDKNITSNNLHWHGNCFKCFKCEDSLVNKRFVMHEENVYCEDCYEKEFAPKCDECKEPFKKNSSKYEYNDKKYHESCFLCKICKKPIADKPFVNNERHGSVCEECHNDNFGVNCVKCNKLSDILKPKTLLNNVGEFNIDVKTWIYEFDEYISLIDAKNELSAN